MAINGFCPSFLKIYNHLGGCDYTGPNILVKLAPHWSVVDGMSLKCHMQFTGDER